VDDIVLTASSDSSPLHHHCLATRILHERSWTSALEFQFSGTRVVCSRHSNSTPLPFLKRVGITIVSHATLLLILTPRFLLLILHTTAVLLGPSSTLPSPDIVQCMTLENFMSTIKRIRSYLQATLNYDLHLWSSTPFELVVHRYSPLHFCYA
jgi:hypothetical protein